MVTDHDNPSHEFSPSEEPALPDNNLKCAVVTGASRGIGYHAAKAIAATGCHVIAVARTIGGLEELDDEITSAGGSATLVPLDLTDGDGVDRLGAAIFERWGRLDGLVAAAAVMPAAAPVGHFTAKEWTQAIDTNLTANWRLIRTLDPILRKAPAPRVVALTAPCSREMRPFMAAYAVSKAGLEVLVQTYAAELAHNPAIKINLLEPYPVRSALRAKIKPGENADLLPHASTVAPKIVQMLSGDWRQSGELVRLTQPLWQETVAQPV